MDDFGEKADLKQSVIDLGLEFGLVTDYTSMLVVREEQFQHYGIDRRNRDRLASEQTAQQVRAARTTPQPRRADTQQPMFSSNRASHSSGGGALGPWTLLMIPPLVWVLARRREA